MTSALRLALALTAALALGACSTVNDFLSGDKIDYKSQSTKTARLEVPPDLTQLQRDSRYQPQSGGVVSASTFGAAATAATTTTTATATASVAPASIGQMRIVREGNQRWLTVPLPPERLWPQLQSFWQEIVKGAIILLAVLFDVWTKRGTTRA